MKKTAEKQAGSQENVKTLLAQLVLPLAGMMKMQMRDFVLSFGMQALLAMLEMEREELCGPRYQHDPDRKETRNGTAPSELVLGGRRVKVKRPRAMDPKTGTEVPLPSWEQLAAEDPLTQRAVEQMLVGVTTRKYARSLEPLADGMKQRGTSKSAVSRRFVEETTDRMGTWMERDLGAISLCAIMIDGLYVGDAVVLCALGIDEQGTKHVLGLWEGATENAAACKGLLENLLSRGVNAERAMLFVIDGSKGVRQAIREVFGRRALVQRCQVHKKRNVVEHLPKSMQKSVEKTMSQAYGSSNPKTAKSLLSNLASKLESKHPSAAASLREGLDETLTVKTLGLTNWLERSFSTTNPIESMNGRIRAMIKRVKKWQDGTMILRWTASALGEAAKGFRRMKGAVDMPKLIAALRAHDQKLSTPSKTVDLEENAA